MNLILLIIGMFIATEGFLNLLYWKDKRNNRENRKDEELIVIRLTEKHKYIVFQIGRFIRTVLGYILVMIA